MGKKKKEEMAKHEAKFVGGAMERGIAKEKAEKILRKRNLIHRQSSSLETKEREYA
jgi:DNA polymerase III alpha subunit